MKFSAFAAVAAGAVLASASPLRVIVVSNVNAVAEPNNPFTRVRFGHAVPNHEANVAQMMEGPLSPVRAPDARLSFPHHPPIRKPMPCGAGRFRKPGGFKQKAIEISNAFRKTFGLPLIESEADLKPVVVYHGIGGPGGKEIHGGMVHIMPFIGTGGEDKAFHGWHAGPDHFPPPPPPHRHHGHHGHHVQQGVVTDARFTMRLQNALLSLGPWEGRAVAFVVGAGIGVLIRMIWVLGLVAYRGCSSDGEYSPVADLEDEDDDDDDVVLGTRYRRTPISAPPSYVYPVDEKVRIEDDEATTKTDEVKPAPAVGNNN